MQYRLDESSVWRGVPRAALIEAFLHGIVIALELDESSLVVRPRRLLERAMGKPMTPARPSTSRVARGGGRVRARHRRRRRRSSTTRKVYLADYRGPGLRRTRLDDAAAQAVAFLNLLSSTTVRRARERNA